MYLRSLRIRHMKRFGDFSLSFEGADGRPRMWTVLIGENGTGKTALLQAIALAAAGQRQVNTLARGMVSLLRDRRSEAPMEIEAEFSLPVGQSGRVYALPPNRAPSQAKGARPGVGSFVELLPEETSLRSKSAYRDVLAKDTDDPIDAVRSMGRQVPGWFVVGYGVARALPETGYKPDIEPPAIERMRPLFDPHKPLASTAFAAELDARPELRATFDRLLQKALFHTDRLLPRVTELELRGRPPNGSTAPVAEDRFTQRVGTTDLRLALGAMSNGYQSTVAWITDLIGHLVLAEWLPYRGASWPTELDQLGGLVLVDELDLYLHPTWQVVLVRALRETFPNLQFVATTHSPLVLAGLRPEEDEIVQLALDPETGDAVRVPLQPHIDPRLLTGSELYRTFFGIDDVYPDAAGRALREFRYLAANPYRSDDDEVEMQRLGAELKAQRIDPHYAPVPREAVPEE